MKLILPHCVQYVVDIAFSEDLEKINRKLVEAVKFRFVTKNLIGERSTMKRIDVPFQNNAKYPHSVFNLKFHEIRSGPTLERH